MIVTEGHFKQIKKPPGRTLCFLSVFTLLIFLTSYSQEKQSQGSGYIDKTGIYVIKPQFEHAFDFSEGLARVIVDGKCGYIDKTGKIIIKPQFLEADKFSEGFAKVKEWPE